MSLISAEFVFTCTQYGIVIAICAVAGSYVYYSWFKPEPDPKAKRSVDLGKDEEDEYVDSQLEPSTSVSPRDDSSAGSLRRRHSTDGPFQFASVAKAFIKNRARYKRQFSEVARPSLPKPPTEYFEPSDLPEIPQNLRPEFFYLRHNMEILELPHELSLDSKFIDVLVYKKDDFVVKVGDQDDSMYVVVSGQLNMFIKHEGKEFLVRKLTKGHTFFSCLSLIDILMNRPSIFRTVSLRAAETSTVARFNLNHFRDLYNESPDMWCRTIQIILSRLLHVTMTTLHHYLGIGEELVKKRIDERTLDEKHRNISGHSMRLIGHSRPKQRRLSSSDSANEFVATATKWYSEALGLSFSDAQTFLTPHIILSTVDEKQVLVEERGDDDPFLILVLKGRLSITKSTNLDEEDISEPWNAFVYPRELIGSLQILTGEPAFFQISGSCPTTVAMISKFHVQAAIAQRPAIVLPLAYTAVRRLSPFVRGIDFAMDWIMLDSGQAVYRLGDVADAMFVVLSGRLRCVDKKTAVAEFGRGDVLGMVELIQKKPRNTTVLAVRYSQLTKLPDGLINFIKILFPHVGFRLVRLLGMSYTETRQTYLSPPVFTVDNAAPDSMAQLKNLHTVAIIAASPTVPIISFTCELHHALSANMKVLRLSARQVAHSLEENCLEKLADFRLMHWLNIQEDTYQLVIYECDYEATHWTRRCLRQADTILVVGQGSEKPRDKHFFEEHLKMNQDGIRARKELILLWNMKTEQPKGTYEWLKGSWFSGHYHVRAPFRMFRAMTDDGQLDEASVLDFYQKEVFNQKPDVSTDFARLGRILTGNAIGLVLGGGGARGASHIGVIQALQHYGVPVDIVGGTSIGSMIGGIFAENPWKTDKLQERAHSWFLMMSSLWRKIWDLTYTHSAMFTGAGFNRTLQDLFSDILIEDLWLPYFCVTTDITSSEMRVHRSGPIWMYARASMSLAGYLPPLCDPNDSHLLLDGGYVNNVPADVMRSIGARAVIAVDVGSAAENNLTNYGDHLSGFWVLWKRFWPWTEPVRVLNMEEIQSRLAFVSCVRQLELVKKAPYCHYLRPPIESFKTLDFAKYDTIRMIGWEYGITAAEEMLEKNTEIRALLLIDTTRPLTRRQRRQEMGRPSRNNSFTDLAAEASRIPSKQKEAHSNKAFEEEDEWDEEESSESEEESFSEEIVHRSGEPRGETFYEEKYLLSQDGTGSTITSDSSTVTESTVTTDSSSVTASSVITDSSTVTTTDTNTEHGVHSPRKMDVEKNGSISLKAKIDSKGLDERSLEAKIDLMGLDERSSKFKVDSERLDKGSLEAKIDSKGLDEKSLKFKVDSKGLDEGNSKSVGRKKTEWTSIYIASTLTFVGAVQFSIYFSSLWPYLQIIDDTATETFFGMIIAAYSLGQMIASPLVGFWSNKTRKMKQPLFAGLVFMVIGNFVYFFTQILSEKKKYFILIARFITGFGSANISLLKAYATAASTGRDRAKAIAYVTGGLSLGLVTGPGFQLVFTPIGSGGWQISENLVINMYTCPALFAMLMNLMGMMMIVFRFREASVGIPDKETLKKTGIVLPPYDKAALGLCFLTRFCQMFITTNLESIGSPLAMTMFALTKFQVVRYTATVQSLIGLLAFSTYVLYIKFNIGRKVNGRIVTMLALTGLIVFHLCSYSWSFLSGNLITYNDQEQTTMNASELVGCNTDRFDWCYSLKPVNIYVYYITYVLFIGTCFPNINICLNTLFSKIIGPRPQGTQQGLLQVAGSSARMIGPVVISALYTAYGPRWSWNLEIALIGFTLALWIVMRKRMVPLEVPPEFAEFQDQNDPDVVKKSKKNKVHPKTQKLQF